MNKKILIVEDEPDIIKIVVFRMKQAGYEVLMAEDGKKGLELIYYHNPALVLLDLNLPVMSGRDVCEKIKGTEDLKNIPVILFTASNSSKLCETAAELGADDYITKPFDIDILLDKIEKMIGQKGTVTTGEQV